MLRLSLAFVSVVVVIGCTKDEPHYCAVPNMEGTACLDGGVMPMPCTAATEPTDCTDGNKKVCDATLGGGMCVQCTADSHDACKGTSPVCAMDVCVACVTDNDCKAGTTTGVCLPTGACADQVAILHTVSQSGSNAGDCGTTTKPCTLKGALMAVSSTKSVIRLDDDGPYNDDGYNVSNSVTIDARGATTGAVIKRSNMGPILTITGGKTATLLGGNVQGATGNSGSGPDGIKCDSSTITILGSIVEMNNESAIDAQDCTVTVTRATIRNNLGMNSPSNSGLKLNGGSLEISQSLVTGNHSGGLSIIADTKFTIVGNLFQNNGDPGGSTGGIFINTGALANRLEFNTITANKSQVGVAAGVNCTAATDFTALNNIIWNNNTSVTGAIQVGGGCPHAYSDIGPGTLAAGGINAGHNIFDDPMLVNELTDAHPKHGSPVHNLAQPTADLTGAASKDLDGHPRVAGVGGVGADLGAYIVP